jgi:YHS domain-containing protein
MDMFTFADSAIATRATRFVPVKVRSDAREDLVLQFGVSGLPSSIILSPSGRLILGRSDGYADAATFAGALDSAWANHLADADVLAIEGVCPVRLVEGKGRVAGDPRLAVFHDGHSYRFADNAAREAFLKDPERFLPSDGGRCVVTHKDEQKETPGNPRYGATYNGRLYLFTSLDARAKFAAEPEVYSQVDIADNGACPHCKGGDGKQVTGSPKFAATHSGRRYLFPDDAHRQAFRAAPDRYLR